MTVWLPTVEGPTDLPDLRDWLLKHWRAGTLVADAFAESEWMCRTLRAAALWWVEHDTCEVLAESAPTIPADLTLNMADLPTPAGLAVFASNLEGTDADPAWKVLGGVVRVSAVLWGPIIVGISDDEVYDALSIATYSRSMLRDGTLDPDDVIRAYPTLAAILGDTAAIHGRADVRDEPHWRDRYPKTGDLFSYLGRSDWLPGAGPDDPLPGDDNVPEQTLRSKAEDRRLLAGLFALTRAKIVSVTSANVPRPAQRRSERAGLDPTVRVLRLGGIRTVPTEREPVTAGGREYKHSWIVSPHFRWQAHGAGRAERKLILVNAYLKGDPALPLMGADRVWRVVPPKAAS